MQQLTREINKKQYERALNSHNYIADEDEKDVFTVSEIYGYGVYYSRVFKKDNKYYVQFRIGDTCD